MGSLPAHLPLAAAAQIVKASEVGGGHWVFSKCRVCSQVLPGLLPLSSLLCPLEL